ncbi:hypothetical protein [Mycolicibacterium phlei]|uniref:hypothetical protein n=1 Tax=Mycolicibacterium phlei TaxID=1771 RepID=UPI0002F335BC|nr:hypothetical protein [Mycolicibacterium phlei]
MPAPAPAAPAPEPPAPVVAPPSWVERVITPPAITKQFAVTPPTDIASPLWGIGGLLLIPIAGAALGYRQARAAQAAERIRSRI